MTYNTTDFVSDVRLRGAWPDSAFTAAEILREGTWAMATEVVPLVMRAKSDYWVTTELIPVVDGQTEYRLPRRALLSSQYDVYLRDSSGRSYSLPALGPKWGRQFEGDTWGQPPGWYARGEKLILAGTIQSSQALNIVIAYERRPGTLVATSECARVTSITGLHYTCANVPTSWGTSTRLDANQAVPGFDVLSASITATTVTTGATGGLTFATAVTDMAAGDFFCEATKSCIIHLPAELNPLLVEATNLRLLAADGDNVNAARGREQLERMRMQMEILLSPRQRQGANKIVNRFSTLRSKRYGRYH